MSETQTHCFGRFLIDLPKAAEINGQRYEYMFSAIETGRTPPKQNMYQDGFVEMMKTREAELRGAKKKWEYSFADARLSGNPNSRILVTSRPPLYGGEKVYGFEAYRFINEVLFSMKVNAVGADGIDSVLKDLETRLLPNLRARKPREIPNEPGFCIEEGFIADDGKTPQYEKAGISFKFKQWPDVIVLVRATRSSKLKPSLLERASKPRPAEFAEVAKQIKTFRKGKHEIGPHKGEEILDAYPTEDGYFIHRFIWDVQGTPDSATAPDLYFEFFTGVNPGAGNPEVRPSLTDPQAIKLFDTIVKSIRLRPTTPGKTSDAADPNDPSPTPQRLPLKTKTTSAFNCPQTGIWECAADTQGITEHRRFIEAGRPMPYALARVPAPGLTGFFGMQEDDALVIAWTLMAYEDKA